MDVIQRHCEMIFPIRLRIRCRKSGLVNVALISRLMSIFRDYVPQHSLPLGVAVT